MRPSKIVTATSRRRAATAARRRCLRRARRGRRACRGERALALLVERGPRGVARVGVDRLLSAIRSLGNQPPSGQSFQRRSVDRHVQARHRISVTTGQSLPKASRPAARDAAVRPRPGRALRADVLAHTSSGSRLGQPVSRLHRCDHAERAEARNVRRDRWSRCARSGDGDRAPGAGSIAPRLHTRRAPCGLHGRRSRASSPASRGVEQRTMRLSSSGRSSALPQPRSTALPRRPRRHTARASPPCVIR